MIAVEIINGGALNCFSKGVCPSCIGNVKLSCQKAPASTLPQMNRLINADIPEALRLMRGWPLNFDFGNFCALLANMLS